MSAREWQFDGLVGPTHNYAGLAMGNLAAARNAGAVSNPRLAALQGLEKMRFVRNLGMKQAFFPPHYRPLIGELRRVGFGGDLATVLEGAYQQAPGLLAAVYSSAFMWAANAATVTPSSQSGDGKLHLTPANLSSHFHRSTEAAFSTKLLNKIFHNKKLFTIHNALSSAHNWGDEGAANHMIVSLNNDSYGHEIFVYGKSHKITFKTDKFTPRQDLAASQAVARLHGLKEGGALFLQQAPEAIDGGVFHNDVIAINTTSRMLVHERAFIPEHQKKLRDFFAARPEFTFREILTSELSIADAVSSYSFNSQLLCLPSEKFALVAPSECSNHAGVRTLIERLQSEGVLDEVHYLDVRESMRNGGGPACLRLRIVMDAEQEQSMHSEVELTDERYTQLVEWVNRHYRDRLVFDDLRDPQLVDELNDAYAALETILGMEGLYDEWRVDE